MTHETVVLQGRGVISGRAAGRAMVCPDSIQGFSGIDALTGRIIEYGHIHENECFDDKILVLPCSKGSVGWPAYFHKAASFGHKPAGWIITKMDAKVGLASVILNIPTICDMEGADPCTVIHDGDWLEIDGDRGCIIIHR